MKTILSVGLTVLPMIAMAAPSAVELAAQSANQSTTFSTGAPIHSPWVVLQQATANASAGWNTNSTLTVTPSGNTSFILNIQNNSSKAVYVSVRSNANPQQMYPSTGYMCEVAKSSSVNNYFTSSQCATALSQNNYSTGVPAYIYVATTDLHSANYQTDYLTGCSGQGAITTPVPAYNPYTVTQAIGTVTVTVNASGCIVSQ